MNHLFNPGSTASRGPSIIIAYATCVDWGHRAGDKAMVQQQALEAELVVQLCWITMVCNGNNGG